MSFKIPSSHKFAILSAFLVQTVWSQGCVSFGVDFQDGGFYFQNSLSNDPFTFVSTFQGCEADGVANNLLQIPSGDEIFCSNTTLQPDLTPELSTCEIEKSQLTSGEYLLVIISNNGKNGEPFEYQRGISLSVGPQQTSTYTPTVTLSITSTPVISLTSVSMYTSTVTLSPSTVTWPSVTFHPTITVTPAKVTSTMTKTLATVTSVKYSVEISQVITTKTATCVLPTKQPYPDPTCTITPSLVVAAALETNTSSKIRRVIDRHVPLDQAQRIKERNERLGHLQKRAPDAPTITVTDLDTADYITSTMTNTAPATTVTVVSISTTISTSTPAPVTVFSGISTSAIVTVTAPTPTKTKTVYDIAVTKVTSTVTKTVTVKSTTTPPAASLSCFKIGGKLA